MKKLTDTQKKWALTACLTTALSFNLIMSLAEPNYHSASFASSQGDGKTQDATAEEALPPAETKKTPKGKRKKKSAAKATTASAAKAPPPPPAKVEDPSSAGAKVESKSEETTVPEAKAVPEVKAEEPEKKSVEPKTKLVSLIDNKGNKIQVKYSKGENEEQTTATVAKMTESGPPCPNCGDTYLLPKKFESNATDLESALRKAMNEKAASTDRENVEPEVASNDGADLDPEVQSRKEKRS
ncbi:MAG: hypothetical protein ACXVB1_16535, partial [Pseudobdellovibrionaceae bacterium]